LRLSFFTGGLFFRVLSSLLARKGIQSAAQLIFRGGLLLNFFGVSHWLILRGVVHI
jgi:hypothetical protein